MPTQSLQELYLQREWLTFYTACLRAGVTCADSIALTFDALRSTITGHHPTSSSHAQVTSFWAGSWLSWWALHMYMSTCSTLPQHPPVFNRFCEDRVLH